jgi:hypothetical protein
MGPARGIKVDQIDDDLVCAEARGKLLRVDLSGNDDDVAGANDLFKVGRKQGADVRNHFFNILAVGAGELTEGDVLVPNADLAAFAEQALDELNLRALAQIVSAAFETQSKNRNVSLPRMKD